MPSKIDRAIAGSLNIPRGFGEPLEPREMATLNQKGHKRAVSGCDIEADSITAQPIGVGYSTDGSKGFRELKKQYDVIDFHTTDKFREGINFYYNLQYDFEGMLKLFNKELSIVLYGSTGAYLDDKCEVVINEDFIKSEEENKKDVRWTYKVSYIPKKAFHIKVQGHKKYSYFDLLQYYQTGLDKAAKKYLGSNEGKDDFKAKYTSKGLYDDTSTFAAEKTRFKNHIESNPLISPENKDKEIAEMIAFFDRFNSTKEYKETLIKYCIQDADICRRLGHIIVEGINDFVNTRNFNSSATISEYYFRSNGISVPRLNQSEFQRFMATYYGGRFENMKKGYLKNVSIYDIKSAYPYGMSLMPILSRAPIIRNSYNYHEECHYGAYCISTDIPLDTYISPLPVREGLLYFPNGRFERYWVDKITLGNLLRMNLDIELHEAIEIYDDNADYRLKDLILKLFNIKEDKKNQPEVVRLAAKIILNSLYGKFIQLVDDTALELIKKLEELDSVSPSELFQIGQKFYKRTHTSNFNTGKLFAPQYAAYITSHARNYLYETAERVGFRKMIGFHTDSIMMMDGDIQTGHNLGDWELESLKGKDTSVDVKNAELWLLKSGFYQVAKDQQLKLRARGVGSTKNLLQKEFIVKRRLGLRQAIKKNFEEMNIISEQKIENNVDSDLKRVWEKPISLDDIINKQMIDSMPRVRKAKT